MHRIFHNETNSCFILEDNKVIRTTLSCDRFFSNHQYKDFLWSNDKSIKKKEKPILFSLLKNKGKQIETSV